MAQISCYSLLDCCEQSGEIKVAIVKLRTDVVAKIVIRSSR